VSLDTWISVRSWRRKEKKKKIRKKVKRDMGDLAELGVEYSDDEGPIEGKERNEEVGEGIDDPESPTVEQVQLSEREIFEIERLVQRQGLISSPLKKTFEDALKQRQKETQTRLTEVCQSYPHA
jgi:hypothetical protein